MINIDKSINYIIITSFNKEENQIINEANLNKLEISLYARDYTIMDMYNEHSKVFLAYKDTDADEVRYDAIELMYEYKQSFCIIKYKGETKVKKITYEGMEYPLGEVEYQGDENNINFFVEGKAVSFQPQKRYFYPTKKEDFKVGQTIEIKNNNHQWTEMTVTLPDVEYDRMFKLLIKYKKIRIPYNETI